MRVLAFLLGLFILLIFFAFILSKFHNEKIVLLSEKIIDFIFEILGFVFIVLIYIFKFLLFVLVLFLIFDLFYFSFNNDFLFYDIFVR